MSFRFQELGEPLVDEVQQFAILGHGGYQDQSLAVVFQGFLMDNLERRDHHVNERETIDYQNDRVFIALHVVHVDNLHHCRSHCIYKLLPLRRFEKRVVLTLLS